VTKSIRSPKSIFTAILACVLTSCTSIPLLVPNPPSGDGETRQSTRGEEKKPKPSPSEKEESAATGDDVDFSLAFAEEIVRDTAGTPPEIRPGIEPRAGIEPRKDAEPRADKESRSSVEPRTRKEQNTISVPSSTIRVALRQGVISQEAYVMGPFEVRSSSLDDPFESRGRIVMEVRSGGRLSVSTPDSPPFEVALPCTLTLRGESALFDFGQESYRGMIVVTGTPKLTIVNYVDVEMYLRGVVPLEIGKAGNAELEALKAQAIAARTYAYNRMMEHSTRPFDVVSTFTDQAYGGATVETPESNAAVAATDGLVLSWNGALAQAYFHSTCGGRTANISDVWDRQFCEYLSSVADYDDQGTAYCAISPRYTWKESWTADQLSRILRLTYKTAYPGSAFTGKLTSIVVGERYLCGRIQTCTLESQTGENVCGGDKVRFVLRRKSAGGYLLRSANFTVVENGPDRFEVEGIGYGHGVGMCQMGAIGRARAGQNYEEILKAYYTGIDIAKIHMGR
jgi:stage II sporulation protein D